MPTETAVNNLVEESNIWYETLVSYRERINNLKDELYYFAPGKDDVETRKNVDHFHNQFHIQLVNIHDIKHDIKRHLLELDKGTEQAEEHHAQLQEKVNFIVAYLNDLEEEFKSFTHA